MVSSICWSYFFYNWFFCSLLSLHLHREMGIANSIIVIFNILKSIYCIWLWKLCYYICSTQRVLWGTDQGYFIITGYFLIMVIWNLNVFIFKLLPNSYYSVYHGLCGLFLFIVWQCVINCLRDVLELCGWFHVHTGYWKTHVLATDRKTEILKKKWMYPSTGMCSFRML